MIPEPSDPTCGVIMSQGLPMLHFCYFLSAALIVKFANNDDDNNTCEFLQDKHSFFGGCPDGNCYVK